MGNAHPVNSTLTDTSSMIPTLTIAVLLSVEALLLTYAAPMVRIVYPPEGALFTSVALKVKAEASNPDGRIAEVRFYANGSLIGVATNAPFNIIWRIEGPNRLSLTAEAKSEAGQSASSLPVGIAFSDTRPPAPAVPIISPRNGEIFASNEDVDFAAEVTASPSTESGPVQFIVDGSSVGEENQANGLTATNPPMSVIVGSLSEGYHSFTVRFLGSNGTQCDCNWLTNIVRIVQLGIANPSVVSDKVEFDILSAQPEHPVSIERSLDWERWEVITNFTPGARRVTFSEQRKSDVNHYYYRLFSVP